MKLAQSRRRKVPSWLYAIGLLILPTIRGVLQYRWLGEISIAERERLQRSVQQSVFQVREDVNSEIASLCQALAPGGSETDDPGPELTARYQRWAAVRQ